MPIEQFILFALKTIGIPAWNNLHSKNDRMIQLLKPFGFNKLENNFKSVYAHTIADLAAINTHKSVLSLFKINSVQEAFEKDWIDNNDSYANINENIEIYAVGDDIKELGLNPKDISEQFTKTFEFWVKKADPGHAKIINKQDEILQAVKQVADRFDETRPAAAPEAPIHIPRPPAPFIAHNYTLQENFTGRVSERSMLNGWFADGNRPVLAMIAIGGMGKSSLAWYWLHEDVIKQNKVADGVIWWSFYEKDSGFEAFVDHALIYVSGGRVDPRRYQSLREKAGKSGCVISNISARALFADTGRGGAPVAPLCASGRSLSER